MCLIIESNQRVKIAKKDIICYKVVLEESSEILVSPYQQRMVHIGEKMFSGMSFRTTIQKRKLVKMVEQGFHSFVHLKDAKVEREDFIFAGGYDVHIYKCVIPEGAKYYKGIFLSLPTFHRASSPEIIAIEAESYASTQIIYKERIK